MKIFFKDFTTLNDNEQKEVLLLRNQNYIRENMIDSSILSLEHHILFINSLKTPINQANKKYFAIFNESQFIGVISFVKKEELSWGLYFKDEVNPILKAVCSYLFLDFTFENFEDAKVGKDDINSIVKKINPTALGFNKNFGFKIFKEDETYFYLKLSKTTWENQKNNKLLKPIQKYLDKIEYHFN